MAHFIFSLVCMCIAMSVCIGIHDVLIYESLIGLKFGSNTSRTNNNSVWFHFNNRGDLLSIKSRIISLLSSYK